MQRTAKRQQQEQEQEPEQQQRQWSSLLGGMEAARFLREHWQKKPLIVRNAFPRFRDAISPDELAGLACEDGVESRLVRELSTTKKKKKKKSTSRKKKNPPPLLWDVTWGPQDEKVFASLPEEKWTLLVQEVNRWVPESALILERLGFLPNVRVDDVMVSYAAPGGSVGPHVDSYDVFLLQGQGKRRWKFHDTPTKAKDKRLIDGIDLRVLAKFTADTDEVLGPGDMLYLPPGFAHHGIAVTSCLTYSIGFRSPSAGEAWSSFASWLGSRANEAKNESGDDRAAAPPMRLLEDPLFRVASNPGEIPPALLARVRAMIRSMDTSDDAIDRWFATFATQLKPGHSVEAPVTPVDERTMMKRIERGDPIARSEEGRWAFLSASAARKKGSNLRLYVGGNEIDVPPAAADLARLLCTKRRHEGATLQKQTRSHAARTLLVHLFAMGALRFCRRA